ncbi:hypothetical protein V5799_008619 [Amblyomma americanum]|uniref:Uncharacterized protein n=1 Tax=Amblyomma americanum TaxID=6943 RepID=A0AAQ4FCH5_AMBAM
MRYWIINVIFATPLLRNIPIPWCVGYDWLKKEASVDWLHHYHCGEHGCCPSFVRCAIRRGWWSQDERGVPHPPRHRPGKKI